MPPKRRRKKATAESASEKKSPAKTGCQDNSQLDRTKAACVFVCEMSPPKGQPQKHPPARTMLHRQCNNKKEVASSQTGSKGFQSKSTSSKIRTTTKGTLKNEETLSGQCVTKGPSSTGVHKAEQLVDTSDGCCLTETCNRKQSQKKVLLPGTTVGNSRKHSGETTHSATACQDTTEMKNICNSGNRQTFNCVVQLESMPFNTVLRKRKQTARKSMQNRKILKTDLPLGMLFTHEVKEDKCVTGVEQMSSDGIVPENVHVQAREKRECESTNNEHGIMTTQSDALSDEDYLANIKGEEDFEPDYDEDEHLQNVTDQLLEKCSPEQSESWQLESSGNVKQLTASANTMDEAHSEKHSNCEIETLTESSSVQVKKATLQVGVGAIETKTGSSVVSCKTGNHNKVSNAERGGADEKEESLEHQPKQAGEKHETARKGFSDKMTTENWEPEHSKLIKGTVKELSSPQNFATKTSKELTSECLKKSEKTCTVKLPDWFNEVINKDNPFLTGKKNQASVQVPKKNDEKVNSVKPQKNGTEIIKLTETEQPVEDPNRSCLLDTKRTVLSTAEKKNDNISSKVSMVNTSCNTVQHKNSLLHIKPLMELETKPSKSFIEKYEQDDGTVLTNIKPTAPHSDSVNTQRKKAMVKALSKKIAEGTTQPTDEKVLVQSKMKRKVKEPYKTVILPAEKNSAPRCHVLCSNTYADCHNVDSQSDAEIEPAQKKQYTDSSELSSVQRESTLNVKVQSSKDNFVDNGHNYNQEVFEVTFVDELDDPGDTHDVQNGSLQYVVHRGTNTGSVIYDTGGRHEQAKDSDNSSISMSFRTIAIQTMNDLLEECASGDQQMKSSELTSEVLEIAPSDSQGVSKTESSVRCLQAHRRPWKRRSDATCQKFCKLPEKSKKITIKRNEHLVDRQHCDGSVPNKISRMEPSGTPPIRNDILLVNDMHLEKNPLHFLFATSDDSSSMEDKKHTKLAPHSVKPKKDLKIKKCFSRPESLSTLGEAKIQEIHEVKPVQKVFECNVKKSQTLEKGVKVEFDMYKQINYSESSSISRDQSHGKQSPPNSSFWEGSLSHLTASCKQFNDVRDTSNSDKRQGLVGCSQPVSCGNPSCLEWQQPSHSHAGKNHKCSDKLSGTHGKWPHPPERFDQQWTGPTKGSNLHREETTTTHLFDVMRQESTDSIPQHYMVKEHPGGSHKEYTAKHKMPRGLVQKYGILHPSELECDQNAILPESRNMIEKCGREGKWEKLSRMLSQLVSLSDKREIQPCLQHFASALMNGSEYEMNFMKFFQSLESKRNGALENSEKHYIGTIGLMLMTRCLAQRNIQTAFMILYLLHEKAIHYIYPSLPFIVPAVKIILTAAEICLAVGDSEQIFQVMKMANWFEKSDETRSLETMMHIRVDAVRDLLLRLLHAVKTNQVMNDCSQGIISVIALCVKKLAIKYKTDQCLYRQYSKYLDFSVLFKELLPLAKQHQHKALYRAVQKTATTIHSVHLDPKDIRDMLHFFYYLSFSEATYYEDAFSVMKYGSSHNIYPHTKYDGKTGGIIVLWMIMSREEMHVAMDCYIDSISVTWLNLGMNKAQASLRLSVQLSDVRQSPIIKQAYRHELSLNIARKDAIDKAMSVFKQDMKPPLEWTEYSDGIFKMSASSLFTVIQAALLKKREEDRLKTTQDGFRDIGRLRTKKQFLKKEMEVSKTLWHSINAGSNGELASAESSVCEPEIFPESSATFVPENDGNVLNEYNKTECDQPAQQVVLSDGESLTSRMKQIFQMFSERQKGKQAVRDSVLQHPQNTGCMNDLNNAKLHGSAAGIQNEKMPTNLGSQDLTLCNHSFNKEQSGHPAEGSYSNQHSTYQEIYDEHSCYKMHNLNFKQHSQTFRGPPTKSCQIYSQQDICCDEPDYSSHCQGSCLHTKGDNRCLSPIEETHSETLSGTSVVNTEYSSQWPASDANVQKPLLPDPYVPNNGVATVTTEGPFTSQNQMASVSHHYFNSGQPSSSVPLLPDPCTPLLPDPDVDPSYSSWDSQHSSSYNHQANEQRQYTKSLRISRLW